MFKIKNEQFGPNNAQLFLDKLSKTLHKDPQAIGGVVVDDEYNLSILYYQSGLMSQHFTKFSEIILVDGTYNIYKAGMSLYSFMVEGGFGRERVVFLCSYFK